MLASLRTLLLPLLLTTVMGCSDDESSDAGGNGTGGTGASGTGASGTGGSGGGAPGVDCNDNIDCINGEECLGPNAPQVCGIAPQEGCSTADDCAPNGSCHAIFDGCSSDGVGSECGEACTGDSCGSGMVCGVSGACEVELCGSNADCPAHQECDPSAIPADAPVHARHDGCVNIGCSQSECPAGLFCVNAYCQEGLGVCVEPMAVP